MCQYRLAHYGAGQLSELIEVKYNVRKSHTATFQWEATAALCIVQ